MGSKRRAASAEPKTTASKKSASAYINDLDSAQRKRESKALLRLMGEVTGEKPVMWGSSIIGFGTYHYKYASGREGDWPRTGFSPRKQSMTVYCMPGFAKQKDLLRKLGPHKTSVSCLYIRNLEAVDLDVLRAIVKRSMDQMAKLYPE